MIEIWKHFNTYEEQLLPPSFTPRDRPSRRHRRQLYQHRPEDGVYGVQRNSFYFRTTTYSCLMCFFGVYFRRGVLPPVEEGSAWRAGDKADLGGTRTRQPDATNIIEAACLIS
ncbi:hypothetical protein Pcinc_015342 [Petrolisthes cinctipes]|uniref:Uncharacterized protein n=1 Tax=Petrolisthes cinctipes TaxID=88211 RepID=A0AAE1FTI0_PETCI|nr:hypothetical protein Pcinc_015342 [Petrolisthes cinctipes]